MLLLHSLLFAINYAIFLWQGVVVLKFVLIFKEADIAANEAQLMQNTSRFLLVAVLVCLSNTLNRALIFFVYWNYANLCHINDALHSTPGSLRTNSAAPEDSGATRSQI